MVTITIVNTNKLVSEQKKKKLKHHLRPELLQIIESSSDKDDEMMIEIAQLEKKWSEPSKFRLEIQILNKNEVSLIIHPSSILEEKMESEKRDVERKAKLAGLRVKLKDRVHSLHAVRSPMKPDTKNSEAQKMYNQIVAQNPSVKAIWPTPQSVQSNPEMYQQIINQPLFQNDTKYASFTQYIRLCLQ